jgi:hypothetical protein
MKSQKAEAARAEHPAETDALQAPSPPKQKVQRVKLNLPKQPDQPKEGEKDVPMIVDEEPEVRSILV